VVELFDQERQFGGMCIEMERGLDDDHAQDPECLTDMLR